MLPQEWSYFNNEILESIKLAKSTIKSNDKVKKFISQYESIITDEDILGDLGLRLSEFFRHSKANHPEYNQFVSSLLGIECIEELLNILALAKFCKKRNFQKFVPKLKFLLDKFKKENLLLNGRTINDPCMTNVHIRFLERESLWPCRNMKKRQLISNWKNRNLNFSENLNWDAYSCYHHNSKKTDILKIQLEKRKKDLLQLDCLQMVGEIDAAIGKIEQESANKNYGFRRITLNNVANIYKDIFETEDDIIIIPVSKEIYDKNRIVANFIDVCDKFPALDGFPVFDHFGLVGSTKIKNYVLVAERDTQTFFLGYADHE